MRGKVVQAQALHVDEMLQDGLRAADELELSAAGSAPRRALWHGLVLSTDAQAILVDGRAAGMFGVVPAGAFGLVWLLGTDRLLTVKTQFLRESRRWLQTLGQSFDAVGNRVHRENTLHLHWLSWLGFRRLGERGPFIHFARSVPCANQLP